MKIKISLILISVSLLITPAFFTGCKMFSTANKVATSINNISDMILNYDKQAKHYIDVVNKAKKGEVLAIAEATNLLSKVKDYKKELDKYSSQMTQSQLKEIGNIEKNILSAAKSLMK